MLCQSTQTWRAGWHIVRLNTRTTTAALADTGLREGQGASATSWGMPDRVYYTRYGRGGIARHLSNNRLDGRAHCDTGVQQVLYQSMRSMDVTRNSGVLSYVLPCR